MAWIPSYQELRDHPKVYALAEEAGTSIPQAIGHLHLLWWWAIDHAPDGDLSAFSQAAIDRAALWDQDDDFVTLLITTGFLDADWKLHNWSLYAGRFAAINNARKEAGKRGAEARWGLKRAGQMASPSQSHSNGMATPMQEVEVEVEKERSKDLRAKQSFETFWLAYPRRHGVRTGKQHALKVWLKMSQKKRDTAMAMVPRYAELCDGWPKDAFRWLRDEMFEELTDYQPSKNGQTPNENLEVFNRRSE